MSTTADSIDTKKPTPTFFKDAKRDLTKPLGLPIAPRVKRDEGKNTGERLSRRELEALFDRYYDDAETLRPTDFGKNHARRAGHKLVRNLAFASSIALVFGFGLGLYSLSQNGGETRLGQNFNRLLESVWSTPKTGEQTKLKTDAKKKWTNGSGKLIKPVKTASLEVSNAQGSILAGIPLKASIKSDGDASLLAVKISNVPGDAVLTAGKRGKDGVWLVTALELKEVSLVLSSNRTEPLRLDMELVELETGEQLSPGREITVAITAPKPFKVGKL